MYLLAQEAAEVTTYKCGTRLLCVYKVVMVTEDYIISTPFRCVNLNTYEILFDEVVTINNN